jgi:hypothetical protein
MEPDKKPEGDPQHAERQFMLRIVGGLLLLAGLIFLVIGLVSIYRAMRSYEHQARLFWFVLLGLPLAWIGLSLTKSGFASHSGVMVRCPKCNTLNDSSLRICKHCGRALTP